MSANVSFSCFLLRRTFCTLLSVDGMHCCLDGVSPGLLRRLTLDLRTRSARGSGQSVFHVKHGHRSWNPCASADGFSDGYQLPHQYCSCPHCPLPKGSEDWPVGLRCDDAAGRLACRHSPKRRSALPQETDGTHPRGRGAGWFGELERVCLMRSRRGAG